MGHCNVLSVAVVVMALDFGARDPSLRLGLVYVVLWVAFFRQDTILDVLLPQEYQWVLQNC